MMKKLIVSLVLVVLTMAGLEAQTKTDVTSKDVTALLQKEKKIVVLDMRTPEEFSAGHVKGAQNIDVRQDGWEAKVDKLNPNDKYLVYCRTNHRSGQAVEHMLKKGFKNNYQMMDGFSGWLANNLPMEK